MRTIKLLSIPLLAMTLCLGLTSCSKEEEESITLKSGEFKSGDLYYRTTSYNTVEVFKPKGFTYKGGRVIIPSEVKYKGNIYRVTSIGEMAFNLGPVYDIPPYEGYSLTYISIPNSITSIGNNAFTANKKLTSVEIPSSVIEIGIGAFSICTNLRSINIPKGITEIEDGTFSGCKNLIIPDIPNTVKRIGEFAFFDCDYRNISSINIPEGVTEIGAWAFEYRGLDFTDVNAYPSKVTSITIPNSVTEIGQSAFSGHTNLKTVYCLKTTPPRYSFESYVTIYVPKGCKEEYKNKWPWHNIVELAEEDFPANG